MSKRMAGCFLLFVVLAFSGCSSGKWIVRKNVHDANGDYGPDKVQTQIVICEPPDHLSCYEIHRSFKDREGEK